MDRNKLRDLQLTQLKKAAKVFLRSQDALPFSVVVKAMTEKEVLPVTTDGRAHKMLLALADSCVQTVASSRYTPFVANRPNDVSVQVEKSLQKELEANNFLVEIPRSVSGKGGGSGYPDRLLVFENEPTYLEVKVSHEENIVQGSARNFFTRRASIPRFNTLHNTC